MWFSIQYQYLCRSYCSLCAYRRIRLRETGGSTGEKHLSSGTPEGPGDTTTTPETALTVRFVARRNSPDVADSEEELTVDEGHADSTGSPDGPATDEAGDDEEENDDGGDGSTAEQDDWIIVTSHADNTIRFRNTQVRKRRQWEYLEFQKKVDPSK